MLRSLRLNARRHDQAIHGHGGDQECGEGEPVRRLLDREGIERREEEEVVAERRDEGGNSSYEQTTPDGNQQDDDQVQEADRAGVEADYSADRGHRRDRDNRQKPPRGAAPEKLHHSVSET